MHVPENPWTRRQLAKTQVCPLGQSMSELQGSCVAQRTTVPQKQPAVGAPPATRRKHLHVLDGPPHFGSSGPQQIGNWVVLQPEQVWVTDPAKALLTSEESTGADQTVAATPAPAPILSAVRLLTL